MRYYRLIIAILFVLLMGNTGYAVNVITGLSLHGTVQKIAPETGDDSVTVRDDSVWIVIDDVTRISFIAGDHGGARLQGGINKTIEIEYDSIFIDADTNTATPIILFGGYGGALRWNRATDKMQFSNNLADWSDIGTSAGISEADYNTLVKDGSELKDKIDSTAVHIPVSDSADGGAIRSETSKEADSTDGGAIRATTCKTADSTDGGAIRSETCKEADSTVGGANRAESAQGLVGKGVNSTDPADGEVLTYYTTGDTLGWTGAGAGDVTDVVGGAGLVDDGNTGAITVDMQIGSWPLDLNADSVWLDSTEIVTWPYWTAAYDSVDNWNNLVNDDRDSVLAFSPIVSEAKDSLTSWANEVNAATDSLTSWANEVNEHTDSVAAWANLVNDDRDSVLAFTSIVSEAKDSLTSWANEVNAATDSLASWANEVNAATDSLAAWANQVNDNSDDIDELETDTRYIVDIANPNAFWVADSILFTLDPRTPAAITVTRIDVTCDADPGTELDFDLMWADARIGNANRAVIDEMNTTSGAVAITSGFDDATIAANKCVYIRFNAEPDAAMLEVSVRVTYTID